MHMRQTRLKPISTALNSFEGFLLIPSQNALKTDSGENSSALRFLRKLHGKFKTNFHQGLQRGLQKQKRELFKIMA
jgi:hypothetical protein